MKNSNEMYPDKNVVKRFALFVGLVFVAALIAGCVVTSIYPFYRAKDVISDPALMGKWIPKDETNSATAGEYWVFESNNTKTLKLLSIDGGDWRFETNNSYMMKLTTVDHGQTNDYDAVLFRAGGTMFFDCLPRQRYEMHTPGHILLRVESLSPELKVSLLDYDWLKRLVANDPRAIRHIFVPAECEGEPTSNNLVLTASTAELQKFILKHLKTKNAWESPIKMKR